MTEGPHIHFRCDDCGEHMSMTMAPEVTAIEGDTVIVDDDTSLTDWTLRLEVPTVEVHHLCPVR